MVFYLSIEKGSAQWTSIGPNGGYVNILINSGTTMYACGGGGGFGVNSLHSSIDNGATWLPVLSATWPGARGLAKIGVSLFAVTNSGIYRSEDNGLTWVNKYTGSWGYCIASNNTTIFVGTVGAILRSTDNGETWTSIPCQGILVPSLLAVGDTIYAGSINEGVFRSTDDGLTFQAYSAGTEHMDWAQIFSIAHIGTDIYAGSNGYGIFKLNTTTNVWSVCQGTASYINITAITGDASTLIAVANSGICRSIDAGASWTDVSGNGMDVSTQNDFGDAIMTSAGFFVGTFGGIYKTTNSGISWTRSDNGIHSHSIQSPSIVSLGADIFTGTSYGGVFRSSDLGQTWTNVSNGLSLNEYQDYAVPKFVGATGSTLFSGAYMSNDAGATWTLHNSPGKVGNLPWIVQNGVFITLDANNGVYRSTDNGATWVLNPVGTVTNLCSDGTTLYLSIPPTVALDPSLYYSNDAGATWIQSTLNGTPGYTNPYGNIYFTGNSMLYISAQPGLYEGQGIWRSTDHGVSWTRVLPIYGGGRLTFGGSVMYVAGVYTDASGNQTPAMYKSEDDGLTWTSLVNLLNSLQETITASDSMVFMATATYTFGVVTDSKIMMSTDKCVTWTDISDGWFFNKIPASAMTILNNRIYASTRGGSLWVRNFTDFIMPVMPDAIVGSAAVCIGSSQTYSVTNVPGVTYSWQFPSGWVVTAGGTTNSVTVTVGSTAGVILATPSNAGGTGPAQFMVVTVNPGPQAAVITQVGNLLISNVQTGNQWYLNDTLIPGATSDSLVVTTNGNYYSIINYNNCSSGNSNILTVLVGIDYLATSMVEVYPIPNNGIFNVSLTSINPDVFSIRVYSADGNMVYEKSNFPVNGNAKLTVEMQSAPSGIYMLIFTSCKNQLIRKIMVN